MFLTSRGFATESSTIIAIILAHPFPVRVFKYIATQFLSPSWCNGDANNDSDNDNIHEDIDLINNDNDNRNSDNGNAFQMWYIW